MSDDLVNTQKGEISTQHTEPKPNLTQNLISIGGQISE